MDYSGSPVFGWSFVFKVIDFVRVREDDAFATVDADRSRRESLAKVFLMRVILQQREKLIDFYLRLVDTESVPILCDGVRTTF